MRRQAGNLWLAVLLLLAPLSSQAGTYFDESQSLLEQGLESEARRALELEIAAHPRNLEARYNLAVLLERIGHRDAAASLYRKNLARGSHLPSVVNLSALLRAGGKNNQAKALLQKATRQFRAEAVPWYLLAEMAEQADNKAGASRFYRKAIEADNMNGFAHLRYARFLAANQNLAEAVTQARRAVELQAECATCLKLAGNILAQAGDRREALALWQRSIAIAPDLQLRNKILHAMNPPARPAP